jgi:hypothetical protein
MPLIDVSKLFPPFEKETNAGGDPAEPNASVQNAGVEARWAKLKQTLGHAGWLYVAFVALAALGGIVCRKTQARQAVRDATRDAPVLLNSRLWPQHLVAVGNAAASTPVSTPPSAAPREVFRSSPTSEPDALRRSKNLSAQTSHHRRPTSTSSKRVRRAAHKGSGSARKSVARIAKKISRWISRLTSCSRRQGRTQTRCRS